MCSCCLICICFSISICIYFSTSVFVSIFVYVDVSAEDDIAECVGWCLIGRLCTLQLHIVLHCNCTLHSTRRKRQLVILCAGHLSAKCDHAAACGQNEIILRHKVSKPLHLIRNSKLREKFLFTKPI